MRVFRFFLLCSLSVLLCLPIFAQAPTTAKIAFVSSGRDPSGTYLSTIYLMNPDGSDLLNLISRTRGINQIAWEPAGARILFCANRIKAHNPRNSIHDIYVMNADGTDVKPMFTQSRYRREPTWAPDGKQIAYTAPPPLMGWSIHIAPTDGQAGEPLVETGRAGGQPDWSPDGTEIVFVVAPPRFRDIYILNLETRTQRRLLPKEIGEKLTWKLYPTWSPDGEKIAFAWGNAIYLVHRDGTGLQQITEPDLLERILSLTWAPAGDKIVYGKLTREGASIFTVSLDDQRIQQLTDMTYSSEAIWFDPAAVVPVEPSTSLMVTTWGKIKNQD